MSLETKKSILLWLSIILPILVAVIYGIIKYHQTTISTEIQKGKDAIQKAKDSEQDTHISSLTERLILLEYKMKLAESSALNPNPQFENILNKEFNLTKEKLNVLLKKQAAQNEILIDKAISLNLIGKFDEAINLFKAIIETSNNNYHLALSNSFLGSIYLHSKIEKDENPIEYLLQAKKLFNELESNKTVAVLIREAENYNSLGIYYKRLGDFQLSKENYINSLSIFEKLNKDYPDKYNSDIGMQYHNLYILLNDYKKSNAIDYLRKAYKYKKYDLNDSQVSKATFLNTINTLINHFAKNDTNSNSEMENYFNEGKVIIDEVFKNEPELNGYFIEMATNIYANYGFHLKNKPHSKSQYEIGMGFMIKAYNYFNRLKQNNYPISPLMYSNLLHNIGVEYKNLEYDFSNTVLTEAISIRQQLAASIQGKQYEISLADSYLVIAQLYYSNNIKTYKDFAKKSKLLYAKYIDEDDSLKTYYNQANELLN